MRRLLVMIAILAAAVATSRPLSAQSAGAPDWRYPVIRDYGGVVALPDAAFQPKPAAEYKLVFSVSEAAKDADTASPGLIQVARFLNLMGLAEADPGSADLAVVIFGAATPAVLGGDAYRRVRQSCGYTAVHGPEHVPPLRAYFRLHRKPIFQGLNDSDTQELIEWKLRSFEPSVDLFGRFQQRLFIAHCEYDSLGHRPCPPH